MEQAATDCNETSDVPETHWAVLGATRFILACIVVNAHVGLAYTDWNDAKSHLIYKCGRQLGPLAAIVGFIVISGFSIAHSISQKEKGFYVRRLIRIWPVLCISVVIYISILYTFAPFNTVNGDRFYAPTITSILATLVFLNGIVMGSFFGPTWSLGVEALYYLLAPGIKRLPMWPIMALSGASAGLYLYEHSILGPSSLLTLNYGVPAFALFWAWGLGFVAYRNYGKRSVIDVLLPCVGAFLLSIWNWEGGELSILTYSLVCAMILFGQEIAINPRITKVFKYLGDLSYPLFLIHFPVIVYLCGVAHIHITLLYWLASFIAAAILYHLVDLPARSKFKKAIR